MISNNLTSTAHKPDTLASMRTECSATIAATLSKWAVFPTINDADVAVDSRDGYSF